MKSLKQTLKIFRTVILAGTLTTACTKKDRPETFVGFEDYFNNGYYIKSFFIPTKGDVIYIERTKYLKEIAITDSTITLEGLIKYKIWPETKFTPNDEYRTDVYGNTPFKSKEDYENYWIDIRKGKIILKKAVAS